MNADFRFRTTELKYYILDLKFKILKFDSPPLIKEDVGFSKGGNSKL